MRSVKITIGGQFWDSQIYSGALMLFSEYGSVRRIQWREVVNSLAGSFSNLQTAVRVGFVDGELFYSENVAKILRDPSLEAVIKGQLDSLASSPLDATAAAQMYGFEVDSPFVDCPVDTDVYNGVLLGASSTGLYSWRVSKIYPKSRGKRARKHHDASFLQVKGSDGYSAVAAAAGPDGLMEFEFDVQEGVDLLDGASQVANQPCKACEWSFSSMFGWSETNAFLAKFREDSLPGGDKVRRLDRIVHFDDLFDVAPDASNDQSHSWGSHEKAYRLTSAGIDVVELKGEGARKSKKQKSSEGESDGEVAWSRFIAAETSPGSVLSSATAPFGLVVEMSDRLLVFRSDEVMEVFLGPLVHWRIFPRSSHYSNQLHLIYSDRLEIVSFVHDYFVDQSSKAYGFAKKGGVVDSGELW